MASPILADPPEAFVHPALFYRGADEYLAGTVPFVREGLADGAPVAVAVPGPNLRLLRDALGRDAAAVRMLDMTRVGRNPGRIIPGVLRAFADVHPDAHVRIIGEPIWAGRSDREYPACAQHEALINVAFAGRAATILCPYDLDGLDAEVLADAEATHPLLVDADGARPSGEYAPERIVSAYNRELPVPPGVTAHEFGAADLASTRRWAVGQAAEHGLPEDRHGDFELAVAEVTANSVEHGGGRGTLRLWVEDGHIVVDVRDAGHITDPLAGRRPPTPAQLGGRGLLLVNHLTDLVRVHTTSAGTTVRLHHLL